MLYHDFGYLHDFKIDCLIKLLIHFYCFLFKFLDEIYEGINVLS